MRGWKTKVCACVAAYPVALFTLVFWAQPSTAQAYLDPGSGGVLLYAILSAFAALAFTFRTAWYRLINFAHRLSSKPAVKSRNHDLVLFSEGKQYWSTFAPIAHSLSKTGFEFSYLTMDETDPGLTCDFPGMDSAYIGDGLRAFASMNRLRAKLVLMTTPQLDVLQLRRSKRVEHYVHVVHAPTDALVYKKFAFDYFDTVLCSGPHQVESIRELEALRKLPNKDLQVTGLSYYDSIVDQVGDLPSPQERCVLLAPTWGRQAMFAQHGTDFIKKLSDAGWHVIVRPHPQTKLSQPEIFEALEKLARNNDAIELDTAPSGLASMARSKILISDLSGIIFDYLFVFQRPVISIDPDIDRRGLDAEDLDKEIWEIEAVRRWCTVVAGQDLDLLGSFLNRAVQDTDAAALESFRQKFVPNFGKAGPAIAEFVSEKMRGD